jgi:hypothetical protein
VGLCWGFGMINAKPLFNCVNDGVWYDFVH